jgi:hypothetical protein
MIPYCYVLAFPHTHHHHHDHHHLVNINIIIGSSRLHSAKKNEIVQKKTKRHYAAMEDRVESSEKVEAFKWHTEQVRKTVRSIALDTEK